MKHSSAVAFSDISAAIRRFPLVGMLGWQDVRQRYRRSALGPLWLTISMGVLIGTIGVVFGTIFKTPLKQFLPFLSIGIIFWSFISTVITESCSGFIAAEGIIKQLPIPLFVHILRMMWRNILILGHNLVIFPLVLLAVATLPQPTVFLAIPGFVLLILNLAWLGLLLALVCTRFRDLAQIVTSALQVVFYLTPIVWAPKTLTSPYAAYLLNLNPIYHLIEIVRAPLLGELPTVLNWTCTGGMAILGWAITLLVYGRYKRRIAYWL
ncbi:ABC transporter permease [Paraburkholderia mimosarum]|uniref:ABC transporter permease n=1 Tax=Paraburkholderia mimosarum TaxID=312026 RepID=UPI0039C32E4C